MKHWWLYITIHSLTISKRKMRNSRLNLINLSFLFSIHIGGAFLLKLSILSNPRLSYQTDWNQTCMFELPTYINEFSFPLKQQLNYRFSSKASKINVHVAVIDWLISLYIVNEINIERKLTFHYLRFLDSNELEITIITYNFPFFFILFFFIGSSTIMPWIPFSYRKNTNNQLSVRQS